MTRNASGNANKVITNLQQFISDVVVNFDGEDDDGDEGDDGSSGDGDQGESGEGGEDEGGASGSDSGDIKDPEKKRLSDEAAANRVRAKEAEKALADAQARLKEIDDADKSELEKAQSDLAEAQTAIDTMAKRDRDKAIRLAFYESGASALFKNPKSARKLLDLSDLELDDEGEVDSAELKKRADALLKAEPYLAGDGSDSSDGKGTGGSPNNGRRKKSDDASREKLVKKYPALATRQ